MKRLKILLHYKIYIFLLISLIYVYIIVSHNYCKSIYKEGNTNIEGIITSIKIDGNNPNKRWDPTDLDPNNPWNN